MTNVLVELQRRQWRQLEEWNVKSLHVFCEEKALHCLRHSVRGIRMHVRELMVEASSSVTLSKLYKFSLQWSCRSVLKNKQSTLAIAFSCDG